MSNLIRRGKEIRSEEDYTIRYYADGVYAGHPLPTWTSTDFGDPHHATKSLPGLAFLIRKAAEEGEAP